MKYVLAAAALLLFAAAPALAGDLSVCDQPISKLTLEQLEDCRKLLIMKQTFQHFSRVFDEAKAEEKARDEARARPASR